MTKLTKENILAKIKQKNIKQQVLAAANCANACRHLLKDERSLRAIDAAMNFKSYSIKELEKIINAAAAVRAVAWAAARAIADAAYLAACSAADAIYSAAKALKDDEVIESIIDKYLPL